MSTSEKLRNCVAIYFTLKPEFIAGRLENSYIDFSVETKNGNYIVEAKSRYCEDGTIKPGDTDFSQGIAQLDYRAKSSYHGVIASNIRLMINGDISEDYTLIDLPDEITGKSKRMANYKNKLNGFKGTRSSETVISYKFLSIPGKDGVDILAKLIIYLHDTYKRLPDYVRASNDFELFRNIINVLESIIDNLAESKEEIKKDNLSKWFDLRLKNIKQINYFTSTEAQQLFKSDVEFNYGLQNFDKTKLLISDESYLFVIASKTIDEFLQKLDDINDEELKSSLKYAFLKR